MSENTQFRNKRLRELAAMLKEGLKGNMKSLEKIKARFGIQEGVRMAVVDSYIDMLEASNLLSITSGGKKWEYHPEEEWDLFKVSIKETSSE